MASSPAPTTPDHAPRRWAMNRNVSMPPSMPSGSKTGPLDVPEIGSTEGVETLYTHPNVTVLKFTTIASPRPPTITSGSPGRPGSAAGLLPWASPSETTIAAGPLQIYRVPGSVSFLRSGTLLHAIMPRSQCWCVDGVSKFVLRVLPDTYYRIELPGSTEHDLQNVEQLKITLQKVLFYERSACPFSRSFSLDLPEMPDVKKRRRHAAGPAKKWTMDRAFSWKPEGRMGAAYASSGEEGSSGAASSIGSDDEREGEGTESTTRGTLSDESGEIEDTMQDLNFNTPTKLIQPPRSVSAPVQITGGSSFTPSTNVHTGADVDGAVGAIEFAEAEHRARVETQKQVADSSRSMTFQNVPTDMPPSPPDSSAGPDPATTAQDSQSASQMISQDSSRSFAMNAAYLQAEITTGTLDQTFEEEGVTDQIHLTEETKVLMREMTRQQDSSSLDRDPAGPLDAQGEESSVLEDFTSTTPLPSGHVDAVSETQSPSEDPYAAIRARIQARRSIGGTTSFHPLKSKTPSQSSTSSTSSSGTITSKASRVSQTSTRQKQALTTALVNKAYAVLLGPSASLVALMLRIAARFADAAFGVHGMFHVAAPVHTLRRLPGSFGSGDGAISDGELDEDDEDDFGVPIRSPVRLAQREAASDVDMPQTSSSGFRERRRAWNVN